MTLETIVSSYGYLGILAGTCLEGETILVLGGFFASRGYLDLRWVIAVAFVGTFLTDQLFFHLGRLRGGRLLAARPRWQAKSRRVFALLHEHKLPLVLGFRFVYGIRAITPFILGMSGIRPRLFLVLDAVGAAVWSVGITTLGYFFGYSLELLLDQVAHYEHWVVAGVLGAGLVVWIVYRWRRWRTGNGEDGG